MYKAVCLRFLRVFLAGATAQAASVAVTQVSNLKDLELWGYMLLVACVTGGISALDKALRFKDELPEV